MIEGILYLLTIVLVIVFIVCFILLVYFLVRGQRQQEAERLERNVQISNLINNVDYFNFTGQKSLEGEQWPICFGSFNTNEEIFEFPCQGKHLFHKKWIMEWIRTKNDCPTCRTEITEEIIEKFKANIKENESDANGNIPYGTIPNENIEDTHQDDIEEEINYKEERKSEQQNI